MKLLETKEPVDRHWVMLQHSIAFTSLRFNATDETTHTQRGSSPKPSTQFSLYPGSGQQEDVRSLSLEPRQKRITAVIVTRVVEVPTSPSGQCILMEDFKVNSGSTATHSQRNANLRAVPADQWKKSLLCRHEKHRAQNPIVPKQPQTHSVRGSALSFMLRLDSFSHSDAKQRKVNAEPEYWGFTAGRDDARRGEARGDPYADEQEQKSKNRPSQNHPIIPRISEGRNGQIRPIDPPDKGKAGDMQ
ncbi:uncharacterized protein B0J16DRAFT_315953 [Fusarium flagelliforme]|uniref:uncharacterized protein n=1 Tax=Fusarium flagelliforme TaxID=2675880 RepID=UPI001E8E7D36|nr:uncharacterized protein B0J16DRAFT_315953 [Fusarium flagelliforme]KAH7192265.1 hypothetical protein B0J16DRAFT_315953 [Fusarium flagelliforme]